MTTKSDHHLSAGSVYDLLQRLRDYIDINRRPGNDLSPKFSAEITAALATFNEPQPSAGSEPAAWSYELAHAFGTRGYSDWQKHITETKPNVPEASIRNLRPLYLNEPQTARWIDAEVLLQALEEIIKEVGTSTKTNKIATAAIAVSGRTGMPSRDDIGDLAQNLLDRLYDFEPGDYNAERDFHGHITPAMSRLRRALALTRPQRGTE
jgi:hypothetical protein